MENDCHIKPKHNIIGLVNVRRQVAGCDWGGRTFSQLSRDMLTSMSSFVVKLSYIHKLYHICWFDQVNRWNQPIRMTGLYAVAQLNVGQ